jgi:hypothetical protein
MKLVKKQPKPNQNDQDERRRLLALVHIGKKDVGMSEALYRDMLTEKFGVPTASGLSNEELTEIVVMFRKKYDWWPKGKKPKWGKSSQVKALQKRALEFIPQLPDGERRARGLCLKLCGVEEIVWCNDIGKLRRLLAAMGNILRKEVRNG